MSEQDEKPFEAKAKVIAERTDGLITKRQCWAYLLTELYDDYSVEDVADTMGCSKSTVYSLRASGREKIVSSYVLQHILEEDPFWAGESLEPYKDD